MAKVNRLQRIAAGRILTAGFFHVQAMTTVLWLDQYTQGLTPREKAQVVDVMTAIRDQGDILRTMGQKIRYENL